MAEGRKTAKRPHTLQLDLLRPLSQEQQAEICLRDLITSHLTTSPTLGITILDEIWVGAQSQIISCDILKKEKL